MFTIIFAAKELDPAWVLGVDPFITWVSETDNIKENTGKGKVHPMGPDCNFQGATVPTFCHCSPENGSITAELLTEMLKAIDKLNVFDRTNCIPPFLLLDGHGSRFNLIFLEYINVTKRKGVKWNICIGVPYGTSYWQVGDSAEPNGCFKMYLLRAKTALLQKK